MRTTAAMVIATTNNARQLEQWADARDSAVPTRWKSRRERAEHGQPWDPCITLGVTALVQCTLLNDLSRTIHHGQRMIEHREG